MSARSAWRRIGQPARRLAGSVADFIYPRSCSVCGLPHQHPARWCGECERQLARLQFAPVCDVCAMPLPEHLAPCPYCQGKGLRPFEKVARLGTYASPLRELIHQIKYRYDWPLAEELAERLAAHDTAAGILASCDVIVPVPLHWRRQVSRGFNQAEIIARVLARRSGVKCCRSAVRLRRTPMQAALQKRAQRLENLANAFGVVDAAAIRGKRVVLVDDVVTTAATLQTLAREIKRHEPASVSAIVLAIADPRGRAFETI